MIESEQSVLSITSSELNQCNDPVEMIKECLTPYCESNSHNPILIDELAVDTVLNNEEALHVLFLQSLCQAQSVIISRMRKDQKQLIAATLKQFSKTNKQNIHVLCIGDGANDIGMIRESDIGIGIKGKEGLQAFNNCDIGLPSFSCLNKLLLVHGKNNEMRLQTLILYFLYKNTLLSIITLLLSYITVFSGMKVMPSWGIDFYNT